MIRRSKQTEVEVQITPMLDMAFQLLTFFILTYRPAPVEGQFALNLLPAQPVAAVDAAPTDAKADVSDVAVALRTLTTTLRADDVGELGPITIGDNELAGVDDLRAYLEGLKKEETAFDQVLLQIDPHLRYQSLITVMDVFSQYYTKISFAELEGGGAPSL
jgi:biopolymer transport protein ExbD